MNTVIIGVGHKARHGKDTVVKTIIERATTFDARRYAFADALKREVEEIGAVELAFRYAVPLDPNPDMTDPLCPNGKQSHVLQAHGAYMRTVDKFYWVKKLREKIEADKPTIALISDMRHRNEFYFVKAFGGHTVKVFRPGFVDLSRDPNHPSETELDNAGFDYTIVNDKGVEELQADAMEVFNLIVASQVPVSEVAA
jgi:hypothetical protein